VSWVKKSKIFSRTEGVGNVQWSRDLDNNFAIDCVVMACRHLSCFGRIRKETQGQKRRISTKSVFYQQETMILKCHGFLW